MKQNNRLEQFLQGLKELREQYEIEIYSENQLTIFDLKQQKWLANGIEFSETNNKYVIVEGER